MRLVLDPEVNAIYIWLREIPYAFGENLDSSRRIDYAADNEPIGVELLNVHCGVNVISLPQKNAIAKLLTDHQIVVLAKRGVST